MIADDHSNKGNDQGDNHRDRADHYNQAVTALAR
jgi:hypothetical protein